MQPTKIIINGRFSLRLKLFNVTLSIDSFGIRKTAANGTNFS